MTQQQKAMRGAAWITIGTGLVLAASALPPLHPLVHVFLQIAYWPLHPVPADLVVPAPVLVAISGGLTTGLGGMLLALGRCVAPIAPHAAAQVTRYAAWSWFCTDSAASILVGAPMNAVVNLSFLALMLIACRPHISAEADTAHP